MRNRFYIGEIVYRGEVHVATHEPILGRDLFEAVQARLDAQAVQRRKLRSKTPAPLADLLFDAAGHAMSPSYATRQGVHYRYYVSQALLQGRREDAGAVARVSAPEIEAAVAKALRATSATGADDAACGVGEAAAGEAPRASTDPDDIQPLLTSVARVTLHANQIVIAFRPGGADGASPAPLSVPFRKASSPRRGVAHAPAGLASDPRRRDALLTAIVRARRWIDDLVEGRAASFEAIAASEGIAVRHARFLAPLAFLSPNVLAAIASGSASSELTASALARGLPVLWSEQDANTIAHQ